MDSIASFEAGWAYLNFMNGRGPDGYPHRDVEALQLLAGKSTRQHLILLLAARDLSPEIFSALCRDAESLLFVYLVTRQNNREFETLFPGWAVQVRSLATPEAYGAFARNTFDKRRSELAARFVREFPLLDIAGLKERFGRVDFVTAAAGGPNPGKQRVYEAKRRHLKGRCRPPSIRPHPPKELCPIEAKPFTRFRPL